MDQVETQIIEEFRSLNDKEGKPASRRQEGFAKDLCGMLGLKFEPGKLNRGQIGWQIDDMINLMGLLGGLSYDENQPLEVTIAHLENGLDLAGSDLDRQEALDLLQRIKYKRKEQV